MAVNIIVALLSTYLKGDIMIGFATGFGSDFISCHLSKVTCYCIGKTSLAGTYDNYLDDLKNKKHLKPVTTLLVTVIGNTVIG